MNNSLGRRTFLTGLAAVPLAAMAVAPATAASDKRIVVLGAGLAGLASAYNLMKHGYDVTVLEAQDRPGGRVQTARAGLLRGGHAELGGVRILGSHTYTHKYVTEFNLPTLPYDTGTRAFFLQGKRFLPPPAGSPWPLTGFSPAEQPDPTAMVPQYLGPGFQMIGNPLSPGWPGNVPSALELDKFTVQEFLRSRGASDTWLRWFYAQEGNVQQWNVAAVIAAESQNSGDPVSIAGGNDRLPRAFAAALGNRVKYRHEVVRIAQDASGVTIGYVDNTGRHELRADRVVCALPFAPLRRVATSFSTLKTDAINRLQYMPAARCYFQTRSHFWTRDPLGPLGGLNMVGTDTMAARIWNTSSQQPDPQFGMLHSYMMGADAERFAALGTCRVSKMRDLFETLLPGSRSQIVGTVQKIWQDDRWAGGGWGMTPKGDLHWMFPAMRAVDGRVHFAGEHTSVWVAWMNGALESADRVVAEILSA